VIAGDLMKTIPVGKLFAKIDDEDYQKVNQYTWHISRPTHPYARTAISTESINRNVSMHRMVLGLIEADPKIVVDHIDGDGLNNQKSNLRQCKQKDNVCNNPGSKNRISKYKGVSPCWKRWQAFIRHNHICTFNPSRFDLNSQEAQEQLEEKYGKELVQRILNSGLTPDQIKAANNWIDSEELAAIYLHSAK
jgi:hypothetical protein